MDPFPPSAAMARALDEARAAAGRGEVPVGAVVSDPAGAVVAAAGNRMREACDPTAHAEMLAIRAACARAGSDRLPGHTLNVTLEPCPMCATAIGFARIRTLVFGAEDPKSGGVVHGPRVYAHATCHHRPDVIGGVAAAESAALLRTFFGTLRG